MDTLQIKKRKTCMFEKFERFIEIWFKNIFLIKVIIYHVQELCTHRILHDNMSPMMFRNPTNTLQRNKLR